MNRMRAPIFRQNPIGVFPEAIGLILFLGAFTASWRVVIQNLRQSRDALGREIGLASLGGLIAVALQEITDFSPCIPGIAVLLVVLIGLNIRARIDNSSLGDPFRPFVGLSPVKNGASNHLSSFHLSA